MRDRPNGTFLECAFYCPEKTSADAFAAVLTAVLDLGAQPTGAAEVVEQTGARDLHFQALADLPDDVEAERRAPWTSEELRRAVHDSNILILQVGIEGAILDRGPEILTYTRISEAASRVDVHPIAIWTSGNELEAAADLFRPSARTVRRAERVGYRVRERFLALVQILQPAYAAITTEYTLECAYDLARKASSHGFHDFYVSAAYVGPARLEALEQLFSGVSVESMPGGLYISSTRELNVAKRDGAGDIDPSECSDRAARIIASAWRHQK